MKICAHLERQEPIPWAWIWSPNTVCTVRRHATA